MTRKVYKFVSIFICISLILLNIVGCTPESNNENNEDKEQSGAKNESEPVKLIFSKWTRDELTDEVYEDVVKTYEEEQNAEIEIITMPFNDYFTWSATQFAANSAPDVMEYQIARSWDDYNKGFLMKLNDCLEENTEYIDGKKWKDTISPVLLDQAYDTSNNTVSAIPYSVVVVRILYNKDHFEKSGINKVPETWEEFLNAQEKLKKAGIIPFAFPHSNLDDNAHVWISNSVCAQLISEMTNELDFDNTGMVGKHEMAKGVDDGIIDFTKPPLKDTFSIIKNWSKYWTKDYNSLDKDTAVDMWLRGDAAMLIKGSWKLKMIEEVEGREFEFGAMSFPVITKETNKNAMERSVVIGGRAIDGWSVTSETKGNTRDKAIDFVKYLLSPEVADIFNERVYQISSLTDVKVNKKLEGFTMNDEDILRCNFFGKQTDQEFTEFVHRATQLYYLGEMSLEEFANSVDEEFKKAMEKAKKEAGWTKENMYGTKK